TENKMKRIHYYLPLTASVLLMGIGVYYFIFEPLRVQWWIVLLLGALLNMYIAWKNRQTP
ncbi:MAG: hypothetical protein NZ521_04295, partial [Flammeovirgaceae bacterium]|nr:hypothetical protein [Flammeovirgaceae bacterium]MDW8287428.1 hypothetical protein [Flammeovirgaceae bacterium]